MFSLLPGDEQKVKQGQPPRGRQFRPKPGRMVRTIAAGGPFFKFLLGRALAGLTTLLILTAVIYAVSLIVPADDRARPYLPLRIRYWEIETIRTYVDGVIERNGLDDPFLIQYGRWLGNLIRGDWGSSPILRVDVLQAIKMRSSATIELTLFSLLLYIPLGLVVGAVVAWRQGRALDRSIRFGSFALSAVPPFVLGLVLIAVFYVQMGYFGLSRIGTKELALIRSAEFQTFTGLITIDGLLNLRPDISWQAVRHLVLPVATLSAFHLATLILVTRASVVEELQKEYVIMARGMGLKDSRILFRYVLRGAMLPALTHSGLTAAQLLTGVYVVEAIFNWHGVSELLTTSLGGIPDIPLALGFSVYSLLMVLGIMFVLDIILGVVDPRVRQGD